MNPKTNFNIFYIEVYFLTLCSCKIQNSKFKKKNYIFNKNTFVAKCNRWELDVIDRVSGGLECCQHRLYLPFQKQASAPVNSQNHQQNYSYAPVVQLNNCSV